MKREILVCDRCGAEAETKEEKGVLALGRVVIGFRLDHASYGGLGDSVEIYAPHATWQKEMCRKCRAELGILEEKVRNAPADCPPPCMEDIIREIVSEEIQNQQQGQ